MQRGPKLSALRADQFLVYAFGQAVGAACAYRVGTGLPCPTCGVTRSLVLSLHGEFANAWQVAPVGPVAVFGLIALAAGLLVLGVAQTTGRTALAQIIAKWMRRSALAYSGAAAVVWIAGWLAALAAAWPER